MCFTTALQVVETTSSFHLYIFMPRGPGRIRPMPLAVPDRRCCAHCPVVVSTRILPRQGAGEEGEDDRGEVEMTDGELRIPHPCSSVPVSKAD